MGFLRAILALTLAAGLLLSVGIAPQSARAADIIVGEGNYTCDATGVTEAVADAITADPNAPGFVTFNCPTSTTMLFTNEITIGGGTETEAVVIDGSNGPNDQITFDGGEATSFFVINAMGHLTVQHLTIQEGNDTTSNDNVGGAMDVNSDANAIVTDVTFIHNVARVGGAIDNNGTTTISQSTFTNNQAEDNGGAVYSNGSLTITQSNFTNNQSPNGGAIHSDGTLTISQSSFTNNQSAFGGAILNTNRLAVSQSSFVENDASTYGGAVYLANNLPATISSSTFSGNMAAVGGSAVVTSTSVTSARIFWSTIVQPSGTNSALYLDGDLSLTGVILAGEDNHCEIDVGNLTDSYTFANDASCNLSGNGSRQGLTNLGLGPLSTATINDVYQTHYPLLENSPAIDAGPTTCDTDIIYGPDPDQLGNPRPYHYYCDIGAIESPFATSLLCANQWNGQLRMTSIPQCGRSETFINIAQDSPLALCINRWNSTARLSQHCTRSEHPITITNDHTTPACVNNWNGTLRVTTHCTRSETQHWL